MKIIPGCEKCLLEKQFIRAAAIEDPEKRDFYLGKVKEILDNRKPQEPSPYMVYLFNQVYENLTGCKADYREVKKKYNDLVLSMEEELEKKIQAAGDPLEESLLLARIGNYIDFGALKSVDTQTFLGLFQEAGTVRLDSTVYRKFREDCQKAEVFLLLCDNCGEIVLDKLFLRQLKKQFPQLKVYAMVRGTEILNDATCEDAVYCGIDREAQLLTNGCAVAGVYSPLLGEEASQIFDRADVILAKGQGNYECLSGIQKNIYYSFLCKCDRFTQKFQVPQFTGMFVNENPACMNTC